MGYRLGIDLGTTFTAAAVQRDGGAVDLFTLGNRTPSIPTVVHLGQDGEYLVGDAARRKALTEPSRVAREFKRRIGDPTPYFLGGSPLTADALVARVIESVVASVTAREGEPPLQVVLTHPASWGEYKVDLFRQAAHRAGVDKPLLVPEPVAAATHYASLQHIDSGDIVAVYDLGGGTFDVTILRADAGGFAVLGHPDGVEQLGGIDFDQAVLAHIDRALGNALSDLDPDDSASTTAIARLRDEAVEAKEALSSDSEVTIPVLLPNRSTEVRLTRSEYEAMIRPLLADATSALRRALRSASLEPDHVNRVLLVGGSSRTPIVAQLLAAELGRPITVDVDPVHAVALGAAICGRADLSSAAVPVQAPTPVAPPEPVVALVAPVVAPVMAPAASPASPPPPPPPPPAEAAKPPPVLDQSTVTAGTLQGKSRLLIGGAAVILVAVLAVAGFLVFGGSDNADTKAAASATTFEVQNGVTLQAFATEPTGASCTISWQLDSATLRSGDVIVLLWKGGVVARDDALANVSGNLTTQIDQIVILRDGATIGSWSAQPAGCV